MRAENEDIQIWHYYTGVGDDGDDTILEQTELAHARADEQKIRITRRDVDLEFIGIGLYLVRWYGK